MKQWQRFRIWVQQYEQPIYAALCMGIAYTLVFWTLLNSILCLTLAGFWLLFSKKEKAIPATRKLFIALFASLYLITLAGLLHTANMKEGITILQQKSALILFPVVLGTTRILTPKIIKSILLHFLIATSIASVAGFVYGIIRFIGSGDIKMLTGQNLILFPDIYPYIMGLFCLLSIIILFQRLPSYQKSKQYLLFALSIFLSLFIILLSIRLIIGCWFVVILLLTFRRYLKSLRYRLAAIALLILVLIASIITVPSLQKQWKDLKDFSKNNTIQLDQDESLGQSWGGKAIRIAIWKCSKDLVQKHWLAGVGTGDTQDSLQMAYENRHFYFASRYNRYNAHNQYIQSLIGNGIAELIILLLCIGLPFAFYKKKVFPKAYFLFLILFCAICFTESLLETNKGVIWYAFFNSILAFSDPYEA